MLKKKTICLLMLSTLSISTVAQADPTFLSPGTYHGTYTENPSCPNTLVKAVIQSGVDYRITFTLPKCPGVPECDVDLNRPVCKSGECSMTTINKTVSSGNTCSLQKITYTIDPNPATKFTTTQVSNGTVIQTRLSLVSPPSY